MTNEKPTELLPAAHALDIINKHIPCEFEGKNGRWNPIARAIVIDLQKAGVQLGVSVDLPLYEPKQEAASGWRSVSDCTEIGLYLVRGNDTPNCLRDEYHDNRNILRIGRFHYGSVGAQKNQTFWECQITEKQIWPTEFRSLASIEGEQT